MKNVVFISPNFPTNYWQFCRELRNNGLNVLGVGDQPYDGVHRQCWCEALCEGYRRRGRAEESIRAQCRGS